MVFVGRNSNRFAGASRARFAGARRVGQANNMTLAQLEQGLASGNLQEVDQSQIALQGVTQPISAENVTSIDQFEEHLDVDLDGGIDTDNGDRVVVVTDAANPNTQVVARLPAAEMAPVNEECEFPVQNVVLQRQINITNSTPQIVNSETDVCGNLIQFTEQMTRTMHASGWAPVSGAQGPIFPIETQANQALQVNGFQGYNIANSQGAIPSMNNTVIPGPLVGRRRMGGVRASSAASYGMSQLGRFRQA
jgi:hypothetical protein